MSDGKKDWKVGFWGGLKQIFQETRKAREGIDQLLEPTETENEALKVIEEQMDAILLGQRHLSMDAEENEKFRAEVREFMDDVSKRLRRLERSAG